MKMIITSTILASIVMLAAIFLSKKMHSNKEKHSPFECGFDPYIISRTPFSLRFFKIAIIFLIFDIEIVLILPLPLINASMNSMYMLSSNMIILIILLGLLYEWNQGALDWVK